MFTCLPYRARHGRADDVIYQDGASAFLSATPSAAPETTSPEAQIPNGTVTNNHGYTGNLKIVAAGHAAVPDPSRGTPRLQARWLERTADAGKHGTVVSPNPGQAPGSSVDTRRPALVSTKAGAVRGIRPGTRPRAATNAGDAYGYAIFDVEPGERPGAPPSRRSTSPSRR